MASTYGKAATVVVGWIVVVVHWTVVVAVVVEAVVTKAVVVEALAVEAAVEVGDGCCIIMTLGLLFNVAIVIIPATHIVTSITDQAINLSSYVITMN